MKNIKTYEEKLNEERPHGSSPDERQKALDDELLVAARTGNARKAVELLANGARVDARDDTVAKETPLHWTAIQGMTEVMEVLLKAGAEVDELDGLGRTPLNRAAYFGNVNSAAMLLNAGAEIEARDWNGRTPLMEAANGIGVAIGDKGMMRLLIERGADTSRVFSTPEQLLEFFDGDLSWMPEAMKAKIQRMLRGKQAFGM